VPCIVHARTIKVDLTVFPETSLCTHEATELAVCGAQLDLLAVVVVVVLLSLVVVRPNSTIEQDNSK